MNTGKVKWFDATKGFGFITPDSGEDDLFVHHSEVKANGYVSLNEGDKVTYTIGEGRRGPAAQQVEAC